MWMLRRSHIFTTAAIVVGWAITGLAEVAVKYGDRVETSVTCRLPSGDVALSNDDKLANDPSAKKSAIYLPRDNSAPLVLTAGGGEEDYGRPGERGFEAEVLAQISQTIIGMKAGEGKTVRLFTERSETLGGEEPVLEMSRFRERPKILKVLNDEYRRRKGKNPALGDDFTIDPAIPGKVTAIDGEKVTVSFISEAGKKVNTNLGQAIVTDGGQTWIMTIDAQPGDLVRNGFTVGRIVSVGERLIKIDFGHPFAGESLDCEAAVHAIREGDQE